MSLEKLKAPANQVLARLAGASLGNRACRGIQKRRAVLNRIGERLLGWVGVIGSCLLLAPAAFGSCPDFAPGVSHLTGAGTHAVAMGDFNEDGRIDVLTADAYANTVSLLLNNGSSGFQTASPFPVGWSPQSLVAVDFNGDGHLDFATANYESNDVTVRLGDGQGGFAAASTYPVESHPMALAVADLNEDGNLDLAAASSNYYLKVLLGEGNGLFLSQPRQSASTVAVRLRAGDVNRDGHVDLLVIGVNSWSYVGLGDGAGGVTMQPGFQPGETGTYLTDGVLEDFNRDGTLDLAVTNSDRAKIYIRYGAGDGTFPGGPEYSAPLPAPGGYGSLAITDVNIDGVSDVLAISFSGGSLAVLIGQPAGTFELSPLYQGGGGHCYGITSGDVDSDGLRDVVTTDLQGSKIWLVLNQSTPTVSNDGPLCPGQTLHLSASFGEGASYSWTGPSGFTSSLQNPVISNVTTAMAGTYSVTATHGTWTSSASSTTAFVFEPLATPSATNDGPRCEGATIALSTPDVPGATYLWIGPNGFSSTLREPTLVNVTTSMSGDYYVSASLGCGDSAAGRTTVVVGPIPATPSISVLDTVQAGSVHTAQVPSVSGATYSWSITNGSILSGATERIVTFQAGDVGSLQLTARVTSWVGCVAPYGLKTVIVTPVTGAFFALTPCREIDTRTASTPALGPTETRLFGLVGGVCGIPAEAKAIALNVTAVTPTDTGNLTLFPGDQGVPSTSALSFRTAQTRANNGIIKVGLDGSLGIANKSAGTVHVIVDVMGYFN